MSAYFPWVATRMALLKKDALIRLVEDAKEVYLLEKEYILEIILRYASCFHSVFVTLLDKLWIFF